MQAARGIRVLWTLSVRQAYGPDCDLALLSDVCKVLTPHSSVKRCAGGGNLDDWTWEYATRVPALDI